MGLMKNKRGVFFTFAAIIILCVFLLSYTIYNISSNSKSVHNRIDSLNNFVFSLKEDFQRQVYITGYRIIFLFEKRIIEKGIPIIDMDYSFQEAFINGTIDGEDEGLLNGILFNDIYNSLSAKADKNNLNLTIVRRNLSISQDDPWHVKISLEADILIVDKGNLALWNYTDTIISYIDITNFEDPLYVLNTNGYVGNKIEKSQYIFSNADLTNLTLQSQNTYYIASSTGPSFLDRLQGKTSANPNGIESLVYLPELSSQGLIIYSKSCVDYIYFNPSDDPISHNIQGMPSWFKLDEPHIVVYNVSGKEI